MGTIAETIPRETMNNTSNACCQMCFMEQTGALAKMCPSIETSLKELVNQVALEEGLTTAGE